MMMINEAVSLAMLAAATNSPPLQPRLPLWAAAVSPACAAAAKAGLDCCRVRLPRAPTQLSTSTAQGIRKGKHDAGTR